MQSDDPFTIVIGDVKIPDFTVYDTPLPPRKSDHVPGTLKSLLKALKKIEKEVKCVQVKK